MKRLYTAAEVTQILVDQGADEYLSTRWQLLNDLNDLLENLDEPEDES